MVPRSPVRSQYTPAPVAKLRRRIESCPNIRLRLDPSLARVQPVQSVALNGVARVVSRKSLDRRNDGYPAKGGASIDSGIRICGRFASDERTRTPARVSQIVETLRGRFVGETPGIFPLDDKHFFHEEFVERRTLVDLLRGSRAQSIGLFENSSEHSLGQGIEVSAFIRIHQRPIVIKCRSRPRLSQLLLAADEHR